MTWKGFVVAAFALHIVLGNVCLLDLTHAQVPGTPPDTPMSRSTNVECPWANLDATGKQTGDSPCASGHCLVKPEPQPSSLSIGTIIAATAVTLPQPIAAEFAFAEAETIRVRASERPPPLIGLGTTVLRE